MRKARCPKVLAKIKEVERRKKAGLCWCKCVEDDLPAAKEKLAQGNCGGANAVIQAALSRCFASEEEKKKEETFLYKPLEW